MYSIRKWMFKPKRTDTSLLAQFFYADDELNMVASELDSFDGRKDPSRCAALVNQLRQCQDKVLNIIGTIMEDAIPDHRSSRDFRVKFPDDVLQESLAGQLWFGAECLAAGSSIMNREVESASMRPLAKALTRHLDYLRSLLRDQCLKNLNSYTDRIKDALVLFDRLFAEFELSYVSAMVPVKSMKEYDVLQDVIVLFSETTQRALKLQLLTQDMIDDYDPALMFTIPRLAMCCGLLIYPEGPLNPDMDPVNMSEMFRPFQTLLYKIRELLWTLSKEELWMLEKALCSAEEPGLYRDAEPLSFDDAAASYPDDYISALAEHAEFSVEPEFLYDANGNCHASTVHHLQAEGSDCAYGRMSQSPSAVTIVANPNYKSKSAEESEGTSLKEEREVEEEVEEGENDDGKHLNLKGATMGSITHQDSADSGMLSENGSISETTPPDLSTLFESMGHDTRTLRHSLSWPSPTRRARGHRQFSDGDAAAAESADILDEEEDALRAICTHHSSTHEFNFHLPLNTQMTSSAQFEEGEIPHISVEAVNTPSSSNSVGPFQRIFFTSDCHEESSDNGPQISFFTDTLNEVFVTDRSFQAADISKGQSSSKVGKLCSKCGKIKSSKLKNMKPKSVDSDAICDIKEDIENSKKSNMNTVSDEMESLEESWEEKANKENLEKDLLKQRDCSANERENSERLEESDSESSPLIDSCDESESKSATSSSIGCDDVVNPDCDRSEAEMASSDKCECDSSAEPDTFCGSTNTEDTQAVKVKANRVCENQEMAHRNTLEVPRVQRVKYHVEPGHWPTFSPSHSMGSVECDWDRESYASTDTSSYNSDCHDDEEIALAIQAAELAARKEARSRFKSSSDLIHRLFVCISGVADQLQTNYASDLRHILKCVFECNASEPFIPIDNSKIDGEGLHDMGLQGPSQGEATEDRDSISSQEDREEPTTSEDTQQVAPPVATMSPRSRTFEEPPPWVPDEQCPYCTSCKVIFTFVRRRHHCRNCGKVFCGRCSSNSVPLPHYGHSKPVRVCNHCFMFQVTPFTVDE